MRSHSVQVRCELISVSVQEGLSECCWLPSLVVAVVAMTIGERMHLMEQTICADCGRPQ